MDNIFFINKKYYKLEKDSPYRSCNICSFGLLNAVCPVTEKSFLLCNSNENPQHHFIELPPIELLLREFIIDKNISI
jgi:hypothetical protein